MTLLCAASLSFAVAACGDDDDDDDVIPPQIDAASPDADTTPDAAPPDGPAESTRSGTISAVDMTLVGDAADEATWFRGASVTVTYVEDPPVTAPQIDTIVPPGAGCSATLYDIAGGVLPPAFLDEGTVTIAGDGVIHAIGPCDLSAPAMSYVCATGGGAIAVDDSVGIVAAGETALLTITGATFQTADVGRVISVSGYEDAANNGAFPIVGLGAAAPTNLLVIANPLAVAGVTTTGGGYGIISGAGPTPARVTFLEPQTGAVDISKTAGTDTEAIAVTAIAPGGEGYRPDDTTLDLMRSFPIDSTEDLAFTCDGADGGDCAEAVLTIVAITVTNNDLASAGPFDLPPGANLVTVSCRAIGSSVTVPVAVLDLIETMDPAPTRARIALVRANFDLAQDADDTNTTSMVAGFGYTTFADLRP